MGFLKRFFRNVLREGAAPVGASSFQRLGEEELKRIWASPGTAISS